ncbi:SDR family NAD(P)-dependent oxidoreductase [Streptomyces sp. NPDC057340]|uniref:SDR family NAD(P)-dependent oxidoreductase n=1 Tax=Streptomyces sp. NPDC057340 TaxID=3346103 RepID=UPI003645CA75
MPTTENSGSLVVIVTGAGSGIGRAVAMELARAGHIVYAGMRDLDGRNSRRAEDLRELASAEDLRLTALELDVLSEPGCRSAVDAVLAEHGRIDGVVDNAGMLMTGVAEGFTPDQFLRILDTNAVSWLRVNRAVLPVMRRQGSGTLAYISSTSAHIAEPFMATYIASKAAGEFLEVLGKPQGKRPRRVVVDAQRKGVEELDAVRAAKQRTFFHHLGIDDLLTVAVPATFEERR